MKTTEQLETMIDRAEMRAAAMNYRRSLTWRLWDGDFDGRIKQCLAYLALAKQWRDVSHGKLDL